MTRKAENMDEKELKKWHEFIDSVVDMAEKARVLSDSRRETHATKGRKMIITCDDCKDDFDPTAEGYASDYLALCKVCNAKRIRLEKAAR
jgi:hypothetical protein